MLSPWLRLVVGRRGSLPPRPACPLVSLSVVAIVSLIVSLIVSPLVLSPRLAYREAGRRAVRVLSRPARLVAWGAVLLPRSAPVGAARLIRLLVCRLGPCGAVGMAGRGCLSLRPRGSCVLPLRVMLPVWPAALTVRLAVCLAAPCAYLAAGGGRLVPALRFLPRYAFRPVSRVGRRGDFFSSFAGC